MSQESVRFEVKLALCLSLLVVLAMWTYHGSTGNQFVWDSAHYLFKYVEHFSALNWENIKWMATALEFHNWHPLTWFSWALDYQLYNGLDPWGYHFSNNLLHTINSVVVFFLVLTVFALVNPVPGQFFINKDGHSLVTALFASLLFAVHPQHVESVAWVAERKDLLCQLFLLLSLLAYVQYVTCEQLKKTRWYLLTFALFFLAVLSKPMAVTFPAVLLLVDVYPLRRTSLAKPAAGFVQQQSMFSLVLEKLPFVLLSLVLIVTTLLAQEAAVVDMPFVQRAVNAVNSTVLYLQKFFLPLALDPHYPYFKAEGTAGVLKALLSVSIFSGISLAGIIAWHRQRRAWIVAWLFYLVTLSPVLGLIQVGSQGAADRYAYFPTLPIYLLIAAGALSVLRSGKVLLKTLLLFAGVVVIALLVMQTKQQVGVWESEQSLWAHAVRINPDNKLARNNLGIVYKNLGDYEKAIVQFEAGAEQQTGPDSMLAWRAVTYMHLGRYKEAILDLVNLGASADSRPELVVDASCIQYDIGWNYARLGMFQEAEDLFQRVGTQSGSGVDAGIWITALGQASSRDGQVVLGQELPGVCEDLIPSRAQKRPVR